MVTNKKTWFLTIAVTVALNTSLLSFGMDIFQAIKKNNRNRVKELVKDPNFNANITNQLGETPLYIASCFENYNAVKLLLYKGANINFADKNGNTCLHLACYKHNLNIVKILIEFDANVNYLSKDNRTPLYYACYGNNENYETVEFLLENGIEIESEKNYSISQVGCDNNIANDRTPLCNFIQSRVSFAKKYINLQEKKHGYTPLHIACFNNNLRLVKLLVRFGADYKIKDINKTTPYDMAKNLKNTDIIDFLDQREKERLEDLELIKKMEETQREKETQFRKMYDKMEDDGQDMLDI